MGRWQSELYAVAAVDLYLAVVIYPRNTEDDLALRFHDALKNTVLNVFRVFLRYRLQGSEDFGNCLDKFLIIRIALDDTIQCAL